jgi:hypothetical protein
MTATSPYRTADPLGSVVSEHAVAGVQQVVRIAVGLFCLLVAVDCVWLGMWPRFGVIHWGAFFVTGLIALLFFWLSWDAFSHFVKARRQRVACHERGLRIHGRERHQDIHFDDVTTIGGILWQSPEGTPPGGAVLWLDDVNNGRIEMPSPLVKPHELGQTIRSMTFASRRVAAEKRLSKGEEVKFGRVTLGPLVLIVDGDVLPRDTLEMPKISSRWLAVKPRLQRERLVPTEEVANLDVLLSLLHE